MLTKGPEPFGRTALEALAGGAALITSGLGGLAEICGDCAVTVDPNDADLVAAALGGLMDAPERRAGLARAGRERVEALFDIRDGRPANGRFHRGLRRRGAGIDLKDRPSAERRGQPLRAAVAFPLRNG